MKKLAALLFTFLLCNTASAGGFFGADFGSVSGYPDSTNTLARGLVSAGVSTARAEQKAGSLGFSVFGGNWFSENVGWEVGYAYLGGGIDGKFSTTGPTRAGTYDYTAKAFHLALLAGTQIGSGKLYGKAGLYRAGTESKWAYTVGSTASSTGSNSSTGLILGIAYDNPISEKLSMRLGVDMYNGVEFQEVTYSQVVKQNMYKIALGLAYNY